MMWRGNASRIADAEFEANMMEELEDLMKEQHHAAEEANLTDEEVADTDPLRPNFRRTFRAARGPTLPLT